MNNIDLLLKNVDHIKNNSMHNQAYVEEILRVMTRWNLTSYEQYEIRQQLDSLINNINSNSKNKVKETINAIYVKHRLKSDLDENL